MSQQKKVYGANSSTRREFLKKGALLGAAAAWPGFGVRSYAAQRNHIPLLLAVEHAAG